MSIVYRPVMEQERRAERPSGAEEKNDFAVDCKTDDRSEYQKAREHFARHFEGKTEEELRKAQQLLQRARQEVGSRPGVNNWMKEQTKVYFWALAQSVELGIARQRLREKAAQERAAQERAAPVSRAAELPEAQQLRMEK